MNKPYFIKYKQSFPDGGSITKTERFEYLENRNLVLSAMQGNKRFDIIAFGRGEWKNGQK